MSLTDIHEGIRRARKMAILTGAGISCNAGIPDFRSSNGLYNMTQQANTAAKGKELFDISAFSSEESVRNFALFMSNLFLHTKDARPTKTHRFIADKIASKKVLRCYTQNIDAIEAKCGLNMDFNGPKTEKKLSTLQRWKSLDVVQLHGDLNSLKCTSCNKTTQWTRRIINEFQQGELPECPQCIDMCNRRVDAGKRSTGQVGLLRPSIVLYGENHPNSEMITQGLNSDLKSKPDFLLIMGTSLKVYGVKQMVKSISQAVHAKGGLVVLVNRDPIAGWTGIIDHQINMDCDEFITLYENYERTASVKKSPRKVSVQSMLGTPPSTPKKCRIRDILNTPTPSPSKKRRFDLYQDPVPVTPTHKRVSGMPTPEESPVRSPRRSPLKIKNMLQSPKKPPSSKEVSL
ncbi:CYFA0S19e02256g1_1 [Cyberlindnera fabianii]|uniref:CYFA0S19e02256g1_1 n=1 Tax=Cyberlindnera fabianii TaxID=36022 RepID=A0A061B731_CYBFA|nr:NAD-dependent histone deacetylase HST3 [Cyberlindnera fabianii]CDR45722.1 CYFA0S19e02256g1_1 [Cyberlindnera fabianii]